MAKQKKATAAEQTPLRYTGARIPEANDPVPMAMPLGACRPTPINEVLARYVHQAISAQSPENQKPETWEEANDFEEEEIDEGLDFSPYELKELVPEGDPTLLLEPERPSEAVQAPEKAPEDLTPPPESERPSEPSG